MGGRGRQAALGHLVCSVLLSPGIGILLLACWHMSIFVPSLQIFICHGDFLLANISPNAEVPTVCHIQKAQHPDQLIVVWWMSRAELSSRGILQYPPPILMERYTNIFKCKLTKVQMVLSSTSTIHVNEVKDIAFAFHFDVLEH